MFTGKLLQKCNVLQVNNLEEINSYNKSLYEDDHQIVAGLLLHSTNHIVKQELARFNSRMKNNSSLMIAE